MDFDSILNFDCSMFANAKATVPVIVNLLQWLHNDNYLPQQQKVRAAIDKRSRDALKIFMPCITPSGIFSQRGNKHLIRHTGLISIDIDQKENTQIANYAALKSELCKIPNVAYCGLSVSGTGFWLLIPITQTEKHQLHFKFIEQYFKSKNIIIDTACCDVARLRFYSYDKDAYFNHTAKPLQRLYEPLIISRKQSCLSNFNSDKNPAWEQYNQRTDFISVLENHGWKINKDKGNKKYFTRPGKDAGISAEYDSSKNVFYVFTENGPPFKSNKGYNPFQIYAVLNYAGDFNKAARSLSKNLV